MALELSWRGDPCDIVAAVELDASELLRERLRELVPEWHAEAACRNDDPRDYYPGQGVVPHHAIETCNSCPVREPCLDEALADPRLDFGIRGGLTVRARRTLRRTLRASHATP